MYRTEITYDYGDLVVIWNVRTGVMLLFSREGERLGFLPRAFTEEEAEEVLRNELGYVSDKTTIRYFPSPFA
jgi:hypothetical protein